MGWVHPGAITRPSATLPTPPPQLAAFTPLVFFSFAPLFCFFPVTFFSSPTERLPFPNGAKLT